MFVVLAVKEGVRVVLQYGKIADEDGFAGVDEEDDRNRVSDGIVVGKTLRCRVDDVVVTKAWVIHSMEARRQYCILWFFCLNADEGK